jgi:hypothetical protein
MLVSVNKCDVAMRSRAKKRLFVLLALVIVLLAFLFYFEKIHPHTFNESFFEHAHCIAMADGFLYSYAQEHQGHFPYHTNGYGDALLLMTDAWLPSLTGPGYSAEPFERARKTGRHLPESECGRVYVQGLSKNNDADIAILFDKQPTPGGDHCHMLARMRAAPAREVLTVGSGRLNIKENEWPAYARHQIELLVTAGISRQKAEEYYSQKANP